MREGAEVAGLEVSWMRRQIAPCFTFTPAPVTLKRPGSEPIFRFDGFSGWRNLRILIVATKPIQLQNAGLSLAWLSLL